MKVRKKSGHTQRMGAGREREVNPLQSSIIPFGRSIAPPARLTSAW